MKPADRGIIATNLNKHCPALLEQPGQWSQPVMEVMTCPVYHAITRPVKSAGFAASGNPSIASRNLGLGTNTSVWIAARLISARPTSAAFATALPVKSVEFVVSGNRLLSILLMRTRGTASITTAISAWLKNRARTGNKTRMDGTSETRPAITAIVIAVWKACIDTVKKILRKSESMTASATRNATRPTQERGRFIPMHGGRVSAMQRGNTRPTNGASSARNIGIPACDAASRNQTFNLRRITSFPCRKVEATTSATFNRYAYSAI